MRKTSQKRKDEIVRSHKWNERYRQMAACAIDAPVVNNPVRPRVEPRVRAGNPKEGREYAVDGSEIPITPVTSSSSPNLHSI